MFEILFTTVYQSFFCKDVEADALVTNIDKEDRGNVVKCINFLNTTQEPEMQKIFDWYISTHVFILFDNSFQLSILISFFHFFFENSGQEVD